MSKRYVKFTLLVEGGDIKGCCSSYTFSDRDGWYGYEFSDVLLDDGTKMPVLCATDVPTIVTYVAEEEEQCS